MISDSNSAPILRTRIYVTRRRRRYPYTFPRTPFVKYTFPVIGINLLLGLALGFALTSFITKHYHAEWVQVHLRQLHANNQYSDCQYVRNLHAGLNKVMPAFLALIVIKILNPLRLRLAFILSELLIRATRKCTACIRRRFYQA